MENQQTVQQTTFSTPMGSVIGSTRKQNCDGGSSVVFASIFSVVVGILIGYGLSVWSSGSELRDQKAKLQAESQKAIASTVQQAWGDGVMWGALAMKNMTDAKQPANEFGQVLSAAQTLKAKFIAEQPAPQAQAPKTLDKQK